MPATATAKPVGDLICPVCRGDATNDVTGRCDLCLRVVCADCLNAVETQRADGLLPGVYCDTCLGEEAKP